jgi:hypothetical protein
MAVKETPQRSGFSGATRAAPFREPPFLWVELTRDPSLLFHELCDLYPGHRISGHEDLRLAIEKLSPSFICFEHDSPGRRRHTPTRGDRRAPPRCPARDADERPPEGHDGPGLSERRIELCGPRSPCTSWSGRSASCWPWAGITRSSRPAPRQQGYRSNLKAPALEDWTTPCREPPPRSSVSNRASPKTSASRIWRWPVI